jgi:AcrR family transcriptional regulator
MADKVAKHCQAIYVLVITEGTKMATRGRPRAFDKDAALRQAMNVFWAKGYQETSMADLIAAMDLSPTSIYAAFSSKEGLFQAVIDFYGRTEGSGIWEGVATAPTARQAVEHVLTSSAKAFTKGGNSRGCMIVLAAPQSEGAHPAVCDALKTKRVENIKRLQERFERAAKHGELPSGTDCKALANYFVTVQHGMSILARDGASRATLLAVADHAMAAWDGLAE